MDRRFQSDDQWFVSPLLDIHACKYSLLAVRDAAEDSVFRDVDSSEVNTEKELEKVLLTESLAMVGGVTEEEAAEVADEVLNLDMFKNGSSLSDMHGQRKLEDLKGDPKVLRDSPLFTHKGIVIRDDFINSSRQRKSTYMTSLKYDKYSLSYGENSSLYRPQCPPKAKTAEDIILVCDAIIPYNRMLHSAELRSSRLMRPVSKFLLRGDTLLFDLRKKLCCQSDTVVPLDNGAELEQPNFDESTAEKFPSSFIFIHDTFYVDSSHEKAQDISFPIRNYMQKRDVFDPVEAEKMDGVKIIDLKLRLGQPYVFQHSGNCEHLLIFHDLRLLHESDPQNLEKYPLTVYEKGNEKKCDMCRKGHVEFVTEKHELLPGTYAYFCRSCFQEFNFVHGVKTNAFIAWPYTELQNRDGLPFEDLEMDFNE